MMMDECGCIAPALGPPLTGTCGGGSFLFFMAVVDALLRDKCEVSEICERNDPILQPDDEYDFIVIGGGAGGAAAAGRLAQIEGQKVLLIEAGMDEPVGTQIPSMATNYLGSEIDFNFKTEPEPVACQGYPEKRCTWPRGKVLGGSGVIHGMMYMRGLPSDYNTWAELGNEGWSFEEVDPIFMRFENNLDVGSVVSGEYHGTDGPLTTSRFGHQPQAAFDILKGAEDIGYSVRDDLNGVHRDGFVIAQANVRGQARLSSARAYVRPQRDNENFHLMLNSTATKIILEEDEDGNKRASAVQLVYGDTTYTVKATKEIVLAAGAVSSPKLLLLSGIGPVEELEKVGIEQVHDLPGVGKNLMNHVSFHLNFFSKNIPDSDELNWQSVSEFLQNSTGPLASPGLSQVTARLSTKHNNVPDSPDLQMFFAGYKANCSNGENPNAHGKWIQISPVALRPKSRGYLTLRSSDPSDPPLIYANYLTEQHDVDVLVDGVRIAQALVNSSTLRTKYDLELGDSYGTCADDFEFDSDDFWACAVKYLTEPENHQASTCKMGPESDPTAVVNNNLEVYGIEDLRIMDASVMPFMVSGNPHASVNLVAEIGVDRVLEKWGLTANK